MSKLSATAWFSGLGITSADRQPAEPVTEPSTFPRTLTVDQWDAVLGCFVERELRWDAASESYRDMKGAQ